MSRFPGRTSAWRNIAFFMAILGPGIITGSVDIDARGITTYSVAGAIYGYQLPWTLIPPFIVLVIVQEMNTRMGIITHGQACKFHPQRRTKDFSKVPELFLLMFRLFVRLCG